MEEQAVIVYFPFEGEVLEPVFELEDALEKAIVAANVGEFDGNEVG